MSPRARVDLQLITGFMPAASMIMVRMYICLKLKKSVFFIKQSETFRLGD